MGQNRLPICQSFSGMMEVYPETSKAEDLIPQCYQLCRGEAHSYGLATLLLIYRWSIQGQTLHHHVAEIRIPAKVVEKFHLPEQPKKS